MQLILSNLSYDDWCRASMDVRAVMEKMMGGKPTGYRY